MNSDNKNCDSQLRASPIFQLSQQKESDCVDDLSSLQGSLRGLNSSIIKNPAESSIPSMLLGNASYLEAKRKPEVEILNINKMFLKDPKKMPPESLKPKYSVNKPKTQTKPGRHFQITLNEIERWKDLQSYILKLKSYHWGIATKEVAPSTGHVHIHFYVQFNDSIKLSLKKLQGCHIEKCLGTVNENIEYIKKTKEPEKAGEIIFEEKNTEPWKDKVSKKVDGDLIIPSIREAKEMEKDEREDMPVSLYKTVMELNRIDDAKMTGRTCRKQVKVLYLYGRSGVGKSIYAKWLFRNDSFDSVKCVNNFWHGTGNGEARCALYDDFRDSHMSPSEFINFIDYDRHTMNIKNGSFQNNYKYIIITSIQPPAQLWSKYQENNDNKGLDESNIQWLRRMKIIDMESYYQRNPEKLNEYLKDLGYLEEDEDPNDPFKDIDFDN